MRLYFLRHGIAEEYQPEVGDFPRRLTPEGIEAMELEAAGMTRLQLNITSILSSPLPRAAETAHIIQKTLQLPPVTICDEMAAGYFGMGVLQSLLNRAPDNAGIILVGHEPDFSSVVRQLTGAVIELKRGGLACVETDRLEPGAGWLRWLLTPKQLHLLYRS